MSKTEALGSPTVWTPETRPWGWPDLAAVVVWSLAVALLFWDAVSFRGALFYFDITEINYPYRDFFARELKAGRLSFWNPDLYCGYPLYSESQVGYWHPLKYLLYPWLPTWKAFNLDTVLSIWLTGLGAFGWLRRHVGSSGALTGAAIFGLSGFTWAHLFHTSMVNALASVPLIFWALEVAWERGRLWPLVPASLALACQVFAGHLQDAILTGLALGVYGLYRAAVETGVQRRAFVLGTTIGVGLLGVLLSAVQWVPSKELIDRTPRESLTWEEMTYGSWHPELLPTLVLREAYGTRARDTDWMDGYYPYHEMNAYLGLVGLALALLGAMAHRDRWVGAWIVLGGLGFLLMLGRFTILMDLFPMIPVLDRGRVPVRYHLWVVIATSALAAVGVDRLARPGIVRLRPALIGVGLLILVAVPILFYVYSPIWNEPERWPSKRHAARFAWLGEELAWGAARTALLALLAWVVAARALASPRLKQRALIAGLLPLLVIADLAGAHWHESPTVDPAYWTEPPPSAQWLKRQPDLVRIFGEAVLEAGMPGYASEPVDFLKVRELLAWSLPTVWQIPSTGGQTPILPTRRLRFTDSGSPAQLDVDGLRYIITGVPAEHRLGPGERVGNVFIHRNPRALPRVRLLGRPLYAKSESQAAEILQTLGPEMRDRILVEDPTQPLGSDTEVHGQARIIQERPDRIEVEVRAETPAYLFLADSFDPGWSATLNGAAVPIWPAQVAFRAVFVPEGDHQIIFQYRPAGLLTGLALSGLGILVSLALLAGRWKLEPLGAGHGPTAWPRAWPAWLVAWIALILLLSISKIEPEGSLGLQERWQGSLHQFTWGDGIEPTGEGAP